MARIQLLTRAACWLLLLTSGRGVLSAANVPGCPSDLPSTTLMSVYGQHCFQFVSEEKFWPNAADNCIRYGGRLVKIDDPDTNQFILDTLSGLWWSNDGIWIGLHDNNVEQTWEWVGNSRNVHERATWTNWAPGQPGAFLSSRKDCVRMVRDGGRWRWHETLCSTAGWKYRSICQYERVEVPVTSTVGSESQPASITLLDSTTAPTSLATTRIEVTGWEKTAFGGSEEERATSEKDLESDMDNFPRHEEVKAEKEVEGKADYQFWIIIAGSSIICILLGIITFFIIRCRSQKKKVDVGSVSYRPPDMLAHYPLGGRCAARPPFPTPPYDDYRSTTRAESNIYLNSMRGGGPAPNPAASQSTSSIDKLAPPIGYSVDYVSGQYYAYPEHTYYASSSPDGCPTSAPPPCPPPVYAQPGPRYAPMNRGSEEYLCPTDLRNKGPHGSIGAGGQRTPPRGEEGGALKEGEHVYYTPGGGMAYDVPKGVGDYAVIPADADIYEALGEDEEA